MVELKLVKTETYYFQFEKRPDWDALHELERTGCAMFGDDRLERKEFFEKAERFPQSVMYGSAMMHAYGTNLGFFGVEEWLMRDCAKIMRYEVMKYQLSIQQRPSVNADGILESLEFRKAYKRARVPKTSATHNVLRSNGGEEGKVRRWPVLQYNGSDPGLAAHVLREIQKTL
ncbi:hypothetical protein ACFL96_09190 [Thermoproteota archaeon]